MLIADVSALVDKLSRYAELGIDELILNMSFGASHRDVMASMELLAAKVMPKTQRSERCPMSTRSETSAIAADAARVHREATIVDGLVFMSDGYTADLKAGNVAAINLTVAHMESNFRTLATAPSEWLQRVNAPGSSWHLVKTVADIRAAKASGKVGLIMGWQNMRAIEDQLHRIAFFHALGIRVMQLTYNNRNFIGDGCLETGE